MRQISTITLSAILLLVVCSTASTQEVSWTKKGSGWVASITFTKPASEMKEISVIQFVGDMDFVGIDSDEALVAIEFRSHDRDRERAERSFDQIYPEIRDTGSGISIKGQKNRRWRTNMDHSFDLSATLPKNCRIDAKTSGGDVNVDGFVSAVFISSSGGDLRVTDVFGNVDASTSGGDITFEKVTGDISAATSGGDITLNTLKGVVEVATSGGDIHAADLLGDLEASTSGGDVVVNRLKLERLALVTSGGDMEGVDVEVVRHAEFSTSGGDVKLSKCIGVFNLSTHGGDLSVFKHTGMLTLATSAGDIKVREHNGGINANTGHGTIEVSVAKDASFDYRTFELNVGNGDILLELPSRFEAFIEATVANAWDDDEDQIRSDFPLTFNRLSGKRGFRATGEINGGGLPIELVTARGEIRIRKR